VIKNACVVLDLARLGAFLDRAEDDLFRLETWDFYNVASDRVEFERYLNGAPGPTPEREGPLLAWLAGHRARGLRRRRVHVLRSPIGDYLRYECEWGYAPSVKAGEEIRILDLARTPCPAALILEDFWLVDDRDVVVMHYDPEGRFQGASALPPAALSGCRAARDAAWEAAEPFESWWASHPEYHRDGDAASLRPKRPVPARAPGVTGHADRALGRVRKPRFRRDSNGKYPAGAGGGS
jgi:hypothetical protein